MNIIEDIKHAFRQPNNTLKQLILINVIVFVVLLVLRLLLTFTVGPHAYNLVVSFIALPSLPEALLFKPWTLVTYFFTHEGFLHIIFNLLNLYWFGQLVREYLGDKKLLSLYVLGGLVGGILFVLFFNLVPFLSQRFLGLPMIGASASVLAIVVGAATLLPNYTFNLILIGPVRIKYIALFLVILSISGAVGDNAGGNIAHLGGAILGWVFVKQLQRGNDLGRPMHATFDFISNLFKRRPTLKVTHRQGSGATAASRMNGSVSGKPSQSEIDRILDKISSSGYESLSKEEKQRLFQASQKD
ncbi:rhomboid family protein [Botryobacter ruber]|uniref:rhomboid family protein n=1 Tax=Botryobacter ruber TaxID=2171629 RepID=UPI000E0A0DA2|nr:rhomboid family intramembrane serine protease [Botryobacter ruber]